jgi:hypothetical protein
VISGITDHGCSFAIGKLMSFGFVFEDTALRREVQHHRSLVWVLLIAIQSSVLVFLCKG